MFFFLFFCLFSSPVSPVLVLARPHTVRSACAARLHICLFSLLSCRVMSLSLTLALVLTAPCIAMPVSIHDAPSSQIHSQIVLSQSPQDYAPLSGELADAYFERGLYAEAKPVYKVLGSDVGVGARHLFSFPYLWWLAHSSHFMDISKSLISDEICCCYVSRRHHCISSYSMQPVSGCLMS
jgi:hypothetical protein